MPAFVSPAPLTNSNHNTSELATANNEWLRSRMTGRLAATASPPPPASPSATPSNGSASASMLPAVWRYLHPGHLRAAAAAAVATATASVNSNLSANNQATTPNRLPTDLPRDPRLWSRDDVRRWLLWCQDEFDLPPIDVNQFPMNGKAICLLMKSDFFERTPRAGDVLYNAIHLLLMEATSCGNEDLQAQRYDRQLRMYGYTGGTLISSELPHAGPWTTAWPFVGDYHNLSHMIQQSQQQQQLDFSTNGSKVVGSSAVTLSPARSTDSHSESSSHDDSSGNRNGRSDRTESMDAQVDSSHHSESGESEMESPPPPLLSPKCPTPTSNHSEAILTETSVAAMEQPVTNGRLLWDFLHQLLNDPAQRYIRCIMWKEKDTGVFKIVDPHGLAQLWGMQKNHLNMNFDKMSRALRYYYRVNILRKVQGERHCYQFLRQPTELKACKQRALLTKYCGNLQSSKQDLIADHPITIKCEVGNV